MKADDIRKLVPLLPPDSEYLRHAGVGPSYAVRHCLGDPRFGHSFTMAFARMGLPLPPQVFHQPLLRAYQHERFGHKDEAIERAFELDYHGSDTRHILNALLLCRDIKYGEIGPWIGAKEEEVRNYEQFFFNVRDRGGEPDYIRGLVYGRGTRLEAFDPDSRQTHSRPSRLLRLAYEFGAQEVLFASGLVPQRMDAPTLKRLEEELQKTVLQDAINAQRLGQGNDLDCAALDRGQALMLARTKIIAPKTDEMMEKGLMAVGIGHGITEALKRSRAPNLARMLGKEVPAGPPQEFANCSDFQDSIGEVLAHYHDEKPPAAASVSSGTPTGK
jgi:hypothetical protein